MSDESLREAERRWRASGSDADEATYLKARVRAGEISLDRLELFARVGHPAARIACGLDPAAEQRETTSRGPREFEERLAQTIVWCETRAGRSLRIPDARARVELP